MGGVCWGCVSRAAGTDEWEIFRRSRVPAEQWYLVRPAGWSAPYTPTDLDDEMPLDTINTTGDVL